MDPKEPPPANEERKSVDPDPPGVDRERKVQKPSEPDDGAEAESAPDSPEAEFERFTDRVRRVIVLAQEEATMLNPLALGRTGHATLSLGRHVNGRLLTGSAWGAILGAAIGHVLGVILKRRIPRDR